MKHALYILVFLGCGRLSAQEGLVPLTWNLNYHYQPHGNNPQQRPPSVRMKTSSLQLPFIDDFHYATTQHYPNRELWDDSLVYVNTGMAISPPSYGVATFDGLNKHGYPYTPLPLNQLKSLPADTLTSMGINLGNLDPVADKVALSFLYQARGHGDPPEVPDSLILDLFMPSLNTWVNGVWGTGGVTDQNRIDSTFKRAFVYLRNPEYFRDGFRFRIRNKATTSGNFDHWSVDYVYLDRNRDSIADTLYNDVSFNNTPTPFLRDFSAMPWLQYTPYEMAERISVRIRNNYNLRVNGKPQAVNMTYRMRIFDKQNALLHSYDGNFFNLYPVQDSGYSKFQPHANPAYNYSFAPLTDSTDFTIRHVLARTGTANDFRPLNDTLIQTQQFRNYYAFDDGSCEAGYYVLGTAGKMAVRIRLNVLDTLRAVRIYFDPAGDVKSAENTEFRITLWSDAGGGPGQMIFQDQKMKPIYHKTGYRHIPEYSLTVPKNLRTLPPGSYYVGIQQLINTGIVVGFDRNNDFHQSLYFDSGQGWKQSKELGSLMLRPVFGGVIIPPLGIDEGIRAQSVTAYPVPCDDFLRISNTGRFSYSIMNVSGQQLLEGSDVERVNTSELPAGLYFLSFETAEGSRGFQKVLIQH